MANGMERQVIAVKLEDSVRVKDQSFWQQIPMIAIVLGVGCLAGWAAGLGSHISEAMPSYLFAYVSVLGIGLGCMIFVLIQHLTRAGWSVLVRRVPEAAMATMPLFFVLFVPIAMFAKEIFPWMTADLAQDHLLHEKAPYLNTQFFMTRSFTYLIIWMAIGVWFWKTSVSQDNGKNADASKTMRGLSAPAVIAFALSVSFASFDWLMSLQPHWYSTIFGVYFFANCFLSGLAFMTLVYLWLGRSNILADAVTTEHYQDLGKLTFGFIVFWSYIAFSQFMLYWYAAIPEEMEFYAHRLEHGWDVISYAMPITHFAIPFFALVSKHVKRNKLALGLICAYILATRFIDMYWLAMPNFGHFHPTLWDALCLTGMLALFFGCMSFLLVRYSVAPVGDPRLKESLSFENF